MRSCFFLLPYTEAELRGRAAYVSEGCVYCHSQQPRALDQAPDSERGWGRAAVASDTDDPVAANDTATLTQPVSAQSDLDVLYDMLSSFDEDSVKIYAGLVHPKEAAKPTEAPPVVEVVEVVETVEVTQEIIALPTAPDPADEPEPLQPPTSASPAEPEQPDVAKATETPHGDAGKGSRKKKSASDAS